MRLSGGSVDDGDLNLSTKAGTSTSRRALTRTPRGIEPGQPFPKEDTLSRSGSRGRHAATPRGSPYLIPSQSKAKLIEVKRKSLPAADPNCATQTARSGSIGSKEDARQTKVVAVKSVKGSTSEKRNSSVPLPSSLIRRLPDCDSEAEIEHLPKTTSYHDDCAVDSQDADIDTEPEKKVAPSASHPPKHSKPAAHPSHMCSFSEMMNTPPPHADESHFSDDSSSVRGYDEDGGFKVKKLRKNGGATLRICDAAHALLSPDHDEPVGQVADCKKRSSTGDMHQAVMLKEHLRRSGERIMSQVSLSRSFTERSFARLSHSGEDVTKEYVVPDNAGLADEITSPIEAPTASIEKDTDSAVGVAHNTALKLQKPAAGTPTSLGHGDWPMKDFQHLTSAGKSTGKSTPLTNASLSPWIPPADWDVNLDHGDISAMSDGVNLPPAPHNTPAAEEPSEPPASRVSRRSSTGSDRIPTPTPIRKVSRIPQPGLPEPIKRFPPRTTSKRGSSHHTPLEGQSMLSPVKESPDRPTGLRQPRKSYGSEMNQLQNPKNVKTFSESMEDVNKAYSHDHDQDVPRPPSAAKSTTHTISAKKPMSTLRNIFHKKSLEFRNSTRRAKKQDTNKSAKSSPLLATPTPYGSTHKSKLFRGFSPLQNDGITPALDRDHRIFPRKPVPGFKTPEMNANANESYEGSPSLEPPEIRAATQTALKLLDMARCEHDVERQTLLLEVSLPLTHRYIL
jgi:hypothetical protein